MTGFKNIKQVNCSLDFNLTHLLTVRVCYPPKLFLEEVSVFLLLFFFLFFFSLIDDIDVESASKYVAGKHRIPTTLNISGSRVIHIAIVVFHRSDINLHLKIISKFKAGSVSKVKVVSANADTILVAINKRSNTNIN